MKKARIIPGQGKKGLNEHGNHKLAAMKERPPNAGALR